VAIAAKPTAGRIYDRSDDASVVVFEDDEPVALAWLYSDREGHRAGALMVATRRDRRGRGLATLAKVESAPRAASLGMRDARRR